MSSTYRNFIGGQWVAPSTGETIDNRNPAKNRSGSESFPIPQRRTSMLPLPLLRSLEILASGACAEARRNPVSSRRNDCGAKGRIRTRYDAGDGQGPEGSRGDVQEAIDMTYYMAGEGRRMFGQTTPAELPDKFAMSTRNPLGVCGMITPWNFPMAIPSWKVMPALVCGNTVVLKPAEDTPLSAVHFVETLEAAGLPPGVVNLVMGSGTEAGAPLSQHSGVSVVSFTGSCEVGNLVASSVRFVLPARAS